MKKGLILFCLLICLQFSGFGTGSAPEPVRGISNPPSGKLLSDWIALQLKFVRNTKGLGQGHLFKHFTLTSVALYESVVNGDKRYQSLGGQLQGLAQFAPVATDKKFCWEASANAVLASMLRTFYPAPGNVARVDSLENFYFQHLTKEGYTEENVRKGSDYGKSIASAVLEWSKSDGSANSHPPYEVKKGEGLWEPTPPAFGAPLAPYAYYNRTYVKNSTDNTMPVQPAIFSAEPGSAFYTMVNEVYTVSQNLTEQQKEMALFWDDLPDGRYFGAAGHWASIFRQVVVLKQLSLIESAEAFAKMNIAMSDAFNACWRAKYTFSLLRPVTYINKHMDKPDWRPLIVTPSHPEYPAAHATMSMAAATALTMTLGNDIAFTDHSYDDLGLKPRNYKSFDDAGKEAGLSRLYGGIHYRPSIEAGYGVGSKAATNVLNGLMFKKKKNPKDI